MSQPTPCDTLLHPRFLIPVEPLPTPPADHGDEGEATAAAAAAAQRGWVEGYSVAITAGKIVGVLPATEAALKYRAATEVPLPTHALMPGLVNAHTHAPMTLLRGLADDMPLMEWLTTKIFPAEAKHVSEAFVADGTRHACAEMLRSGTTCFNDMYFYPETAAEVVEQVGMRANLGMILLMFPTMYASGPDEYIAKGKALHAKLSAAGWAGGRLSLSWAPHAPYTVADATWLELGRLCEEMQCTLHTHLHETKGEVECSCKLDSASPLGQFLCHKSDQPSSPLLNFQRMGLLGPRLVAAHMTTLSAEEVQLCGGARAIMIEFSAGCQPASRLSSAQSHQRDQPAPRTPATDKHARTHAEAGVSVAHCPTSNLKLASGLCPVAGLLRAGANVALGTDGTSSNNTLDMVAEMKLAAILAKGVAQDAAAVPALSAIQVCMHASIAARACRPGRAPRTRAILHPAHPSWLSTALVRTR
eukprot:COSAG01_NODE_8457_length_2780_cov_3.509138_4_plen_474_part_00